jgi:type IV pilus assembly protein PilF
MKNHMFVLLAAVVVFAMPLLTGCAAPEIREVSATSAPVDQAEMERRARLRLELAGAYFSRGQNSTALEEVRQALVAWPQLVEGYNLRALIQANMGDESGTEESFRRALQLSPNNADTLHNLGWYRCQQRRFKEADALFQQAMNQPQYGATVRTLLARGVCEARDNRWADAEATLLSAYQLEASNPATAVNLAEVLLKRGQFERARFYIKRVNDNPDLSTAQSLWLAARIEHRAGNTQQAQGLGTRMTQRFPQSPEAARFERGQFDDQ